MRLSLLAACALVSTHSLAAAPKIAAPIWAEQSAAAKTAALTIVAGQGVMLQSSKIAFADAGTINPLDVQLVRQLFTLRNDTSKPITITQFEASCPCTSAAVAGDDALHVSPADGSILTIAPAHQAEIAVTVSLFRHAPGPFTNSIFVHVKDETNYVALLQVNGTLMPIVTFSPDVLDFGKMHPGTSRTLYFKVIADSRLATGDSLPRMISSDGDLKLKADSVSVYNGGKLSQAYTATLKASHKGTVSGRLTFAPVEGAIAGGGDAGDLANSMLSDAGLEITGHIAQ